MNSTLGVDPFLRKNKKKYTKIILHLKGFQFFWHHFITLFFALLIIATSSGFRIEISTQKQSSKETK